MNVDGPRARANRPAAAGVALAAGAMLLAVFARGIRWDETWEHAQILAGAIVYPEGHPLALYVHNAFSLQTWLSGLLASAGLGPLLLCALRNLLFLAATLVPVFLLVTTMTRSALAAAAAALLLLQGTMLEFDGSYPTMVWPEIYSNGHIGGGAVLFALWALASGRQRTAFILLGALPAVHIGQWPPLAGTLLVYTGAAIYGHRSRTGTPANLRANLACAALGFALTLVFWFLHRQSVQPMPESGPFAVRDGAHAVWRGYTALHDPHRAFPPGNGHVVLLGTLFLGALAAWNGPGRHFRRASIWLAVFCAGTAAAVWTVMAIHAWLGPQIPFLLIAWMPYRLINLIPPLCVALMAAAVVARWPAGGRWGLAAALIAGALQPLWPHLVGNTLHQRYLAGGEFVAYGLYGAAFIALWPAQGPARRILAPLALFALSALAWYHQFGAVCIVAGGGLAAFAQRCGSPGRRAPGPATRITERLSRVAHRSLLAATSIAAAALLGHQLQYRQQLPQSPFQAAVQTALAGDRALLAGPPDSILLQATTSQPVLAEAATPSLISYVPNIGPAIDELYQDLYGYGFTLPKPGTPAPPPWQTQWRARSPEAWRALATTYGITHVIAPTNCQLQLPLLLEKEDYRLYAINAEEQ